MSFLVIKYQNDLLHVIISRGTIKKEIKQGKSIKKCAVVFNEVPMNRLI